MWVTQFFGFDGSLLQIFGQIECLMSLQACTAVNNTCNNLCVSDEKYPLASRLSSGPALGTCTFSQPLSEQ